MISGWQLILCIDMKNARRAKIKTEGQTLGFNIVDNCRSFPLEYPSHVTFHHHGCVLSLLFLTHLAECRLHLSVRRQNSRTRWFVTLTDHLFKGQFEQRPPNNTTLWNAEVFDAGRIFDKLGRLDEGGGGVRRRKKICWQEALQGECRGSVSGVFLRASLPQKGCREDEGM